MAIEPAGVRWSGGMGVAMLAFMPDVGLRTWRKQLGRALQTARRAEGMTQEEVASALNVDPQTILVKPAGVLVVTYQRA